MKNKCALFTAFIFLSLAHVSEADNIIPRLHLPKPVKKIDQPQHRGYRLDWCKVFEGQCGKDAADAFCQANGYKSAHSFEIDQNVKVQTMIISNNAICDPAHHSCDSFKFISCQ